MIPQTLPQTLTSVEKHTTETPGIYMHCSFPVLFIDRSMKILSCNGAFESLFGSLGAPLPGEKTAYFSDIFGRALGITDLRGIRDTLASGTNGSFWKGEVTIKSRDTISAHIKVYIFPLEARHSEPNEFVVMFDDVSEDLRRLRRGIFVSLLEASRLKDNDTGNHVVRVNHYAKRLSEEIFNNSSPAYRRIDADFIDNIGFLASMHDVGKIGTPDDILNKNGPLSEWEWSIMREHTKNGAFILSSYPHPMAKEIALSHHERWDGTGYPFRLSGDSIPLAARIVTIADVYDALRMERSYKPAAGHESAIRKMIAGKETLFDPGLIDAFVAAEGDFARIYDKHSDG